MAMAGLACAPQGLGNAGMVFEAGKEYEGFLFASLTAAGTAEAAGSVALTVSLEDYQSHKVLASQTLTVAGSEFVQVGVGA